MIFAPAIREARLRAGLRQADLAQAVGVTKQVVSLWETGKSAPSLSNWARIASALSTAFRVIAEPT